jgi:hypothetical protein
MTDDTDIEFSQVPQSSGYQNTPTVAYSDINKEFEAQAQQKIREMIDGNGVKGSDIQFLHFEGATLQFLAFTKLQFRFKTLERTEMGRKGNMQQIAGKLALEEEITKQEQRITHRGDIIKRIQTHIVESRKDMGYAADGQMIKLPFLYTDYVHYEACNTCKSKGDVQCQRCNAQGYENCPQCKAQGLVVCPQCKGSQFMQTPKGREQCTKCKGRGKTGCSLCQERRKILCNVCKTKGTTTCTVCNGHGWNSHIYTVEIDAMPSFSFDREAIKHRVGDVIETLGVKLLDHATIKPIFKTETDKSEDERDFITIPYIVHVPFAEIRYSIDSQIYNTLIFGYDCALKYVPFLLDKLLKAPMERLKEAAENRGNVAEKVKKAAEYKFLRQALLLSATIPLGQAAKRLKKANPHGVQNDTIKSVIQNADRALKNITRKPRQIAMIAMLIFTALLYGLYIIGGLRGGIIGIIGADIPQAFVDGGFLLLSIALGVAAIKLTGAFAMIKALGDIIPKAKRKSFMPKAGKMGLRFMMMAPLLFLAAIELGFHLPAESLAASLPDWYQAIRAYITRQILGA